MPIKNHLRVLIIHFKHYKTLDKQNILHYNCIYKLQKEKHHEASNKY